ncbi:hypothetical protein PLICRDRAFT_26950 [Plicaturopsis crispa FD-325 SS-3]|nr:hypothetical protein PLICRDRAFT_26950 [Plicaturopsis crispa FD-325 SS-3]
MRGEVCVGAASFLSFVALLLLIFAHVGQISTSTVPRGIAMAKVNVSGYGEGLGKAFSDPIDGLYTFNASAPLQVKAGLRQSYQFGLYSYCAYTEANLGTCSNETVANRFEPYLAITSDMFSNYSQFTDAIIGNTTLNDTSYLKNSSKAAYYLILLGSICAALALFTGVIKHTVAFFVSTSLSMLGSLMLLIGAAIWTSMIKKTESINNFTVGTDTTPIPLGITVSVGGGLYLVWAAFACLVVSIIPYMLSCCTYRG